MKTLKNILSKALLLSLTLAMCVSMTIGAEDAQWSEVFTENYDNKTSVPTDYITPDTDTKFSTKISDGALETKYTSAVYIEPAGMSNRTATLTTDSGLVEVFKNGSYRAYLQDTVTDAYTFKVFSETGNNTYFVTDMGGSKAFRIGSHAVAANKFRYNRLWLLADKNQQVFTTSDNDARIVVEYYAVDDTPDNDFGMAQTLTVNYKNSSDAAKSQTLTIADSDLNTWKTWEIDLNDIDLTKTTTKDNSPWNISFSTPYTAELNAVPTVASLTASQRDPGFEVYIRSVRIIKVEDTSTPVFDNTKRTVKIPLGTGGNCGDTKVSFDLKVSAEDYSEDGAYRVSLANENQDELATLQIEDNGSTQSIYTISSDGSGNEVKSAALYTGDILDQTINFTLGLSFRDRTFTLSALNGSDTLIEETAPVAINNLDQVPGCAFADYLVITHSKNTVGTVATIDNISLQYTEDGAGVLAKEDLDAIDLDALVEDSFVLPNTGDINGADIEWVSSDPSILEILVEDGVYTATPICDVEAQEVTLTATATIDVVSCTKEFTITVAEHADHIKLEEEVAALELEELGGTGRASADFTVPTQGSDENVYVSWSSDDIDYTDGAAIIVSGGVAQVFRGEWDTVVTLTATITVGNFSDTKDFVITIPGLEGVKATIGAMTETPSTVEGINYISSAVRVSSPGVSGPLTFAAFSLDANGNVVDREEHTQVVSEYSTYDFAITNLQTTGATEVKYYFWDANGVSIINNEPTQVKDLVAEGKARGVRLNWTASVDDFESIAYYAVYRDGALIDMVIDSTTYLDTEVVVGEEHTYTVVPFDKNDLCPANSNESSAASLSMYYIDFEHGTMDGFAEHSPGGSYVIWYASSIDGVPAAYAANGKAIGLKIPKISTTDTDITFEITFYDNDTVLRLDYMLSDGVTRVQNHEIPGSGGNTGTWKTVAVRASNIGIVGSTVVSGSDLNIAGGEKYIRKIRAIQTEKYE